MELYKCHVYYRQNKRARMMSICEPLLSIVPVDTTASVSSI